MRVISLSRKKYWKTHLVFYNNMPDQEQYTIAEFGKLIKDKYPQYSGINDDELVTKILEKYPEYNDKIIRDIQEPEVTPTAEPTRKDVPPEALELTQPEFLQKFFPQSVSDPEVDITPTEEEIVQVSMWRRHRVQMLP